MKKRRYQYHDRVLGFITVHLARNYFCSKKISQHIKRQVLSCANITITVGFISLYFNVTYYFVFVIEILQHKNTEKQYIVIILLYRAQASKTQVDSRDQPIVVSEVGL